jgi:hypothetical protein
VSQVTTCKRDTAQGRPIGPLTSIRGQHLATRTGTVMVSSLRAGPDTVSVTHVPRLTMIAPK